MILRKASLFFLFAYLSIIPKEVSFSGNWFSEKNAFRNGFEFLQIHLHDGKFIFAKLSYNIEKQWEETRVLGIFDERDGKIELKPEICNVYATKKLGQRWVLIQGFDCDHINLQLTKNEQKIIISPSIGILNSVSLRRGKISSENTIDAIVVSHEKKIIQAWSLGMRYIKKGSSATLNGKGITILETVDSTGSFESTEKVQQGDIISITSQRTSDIFD